MLPVLIPEYFCLISGVGVHEEDKVAQDLAGRPAGIADRNIQKITSVLPPGCKEHPLKFFREQTRNGQFIAAVDGKCKTSVEGQIVSAGLAVTIPHDPEVTGYFAEIYEEVGLLSDILRKRVEKASLQIFANNNGAEDTFVADREWQNGKTEYVIGGRRVTLQSVVASGVGQGKGKYTLAYVGAILL